MMDRLPHGAVVMTLLLLPGCIDAPREIAVEAREIQGDCRSAEQLEGSDEACIAMFERAGERVHEGVRVWSGTMRALDQALDRLPPLEADTTGLARALTVTPEPEPRGGATLVTGTGTSAPARHDVVRPMEVSKPLHAEPPRAEPAPRPIRTAEEERPSPGPEVRSPSRTRAVPTPDARRPVDRAVRPVDRGEVRP